MSRAACSFLLRVVFAFGILVFVVPTGLYPGVYRAIGNACFGSFGADRISRFDGFVDPLGMRDTRIRVGSNRYGPPGFGAGILVNSVREGYVPLATYVALAWATPVTWRRRLRALWIGLIAVQAFVLVRMATTLLAGFSRVRLEDGHLLDVSSFWQKAFGRADQLLGTDLQLTYVVPILVWMLLLVRTDDLLSLRAPAPSHAGVDSIPPRAAPRSRSIRRATHPPAR